MSENVIISPIFYMGNKKKLINKGLINLFPKNIDTFIDLFGGSGVVSMNTEAKRYVINDIDINLYHLYQMFKLNGYQCIINHIENRIDEYGLAKERTSHKVFTDDRVKKYKSAYVNFRSYYNKNPNVLDFYTLMFYSFSQQFRFNSKGEFNMPCGNDCFADKNKEYIENGCKFFSSSNVHISNKDFRDIDFNDLTDKDFVYLDPPYFNTTATYNENGGWSIKDESDLYALCERLNNNGIKFAMSNVYENKNIKNENLIEWVNKMSWNVYTFNGFTYTSCGKGNSDAKEILITNY